MTKYFTEETLLYKQTANKMNHIGCINIIIVLKDEEVKHQAYNILLCSRKYVELQSIESMNNFTFCLNNCQNIPMN